MDFNFGNLVSAAVGAVVKVATAVVEFFSPTAAAGGILGGLAGIAEAVLGASAAVAEAREDGELSDEQAEELFEEKFKALLGAYMLSIGSGSSGSDSDEDENSISDNSIGAMANKSWNSIKGIGSDIWAGAQNRGNKAFDSKYDFYNWITLGIPEGIRIPNAERSAKAFDSGYDFTNWLSFGGTDMVKETFDPEDPLSKEHWENSFALASTIFGARVTKSGIGKSSMIEEGSITNKKSIVDTVSKENKEFAMDPVDVVTGSLYIPATDIVLPDIHEEFKIERKYESINNSLGLLGLGWTNNFETYLSIVDEKANVLCSDGHIETFYQIEDEWVNDKGGAKIYSLSREKDFWIFKSNKDKKAYRYNNLGKLINITDKHNNKLSLTYIGENIDTLTTFSNYKLFFTYKDGKVIEIKDELGRTIQYKYNGDYLTDVIHVDKGITRYTYDEKGYISSITDQNGHTYTKNFFDEKGRVIKQEYPNGDVAEASYDDGEKENTFYYHGSERTEKTRYNRDNLITHNIYEDGTTEEYKYDDYQNKIYIKDRNGFETNRLYNEFGSLINETLPNGLITEYTYDENENLIKEEDNEGKEIIYTYDSEGNLNNKKTKISVGEWKTESYTYDSKEEF